MTTEILSAFLIGYSNSDFTDPHDVVLADEAPDCRTTFTHMGARYSGFETCRHKATQLSSDGFHYDHNAHHWLAIGLKERGEIQSINISTKWFTGNQVRAVTVTLIDELTGKTHKILTREPLNPDSEHRFPVDKIPATECLIQCYSEGGIARIHLHGTPAAEALPQPENLLEKATISHISNDHYGNPAMAVAGKRLERHMVGWESARTGFGERALFHLHEPAVIQELVVDTYLHRLNAPLAAYLFGTNQPDMEQAPRWKLVLASGKEIIPDNFQEYMLKQNYLATEAGQNFEIRLHLPSDTWIPLLTKGPLSPDTYHRFRDLHPHDSVSHLLYMHYPNGGIHGLKAFKKST